MEFHFDIEQGSYEWHELRNGKIGGTSSKGLFTKGDTLKLQLLSELTEDFVLEEGFVSDAMLRGKELEPEAKQILCDKIGVELLDCGWIQSDYKYMGISPDGLSKDGKVSCEIKCPEGKKHIQTILGDAIPLDHIHQCLHYFTVNPALERLYFMSYRPESIRPVFMTDINRDSKINIGTQARPVLMTVSQAVEKSISAYVELEKEIENDILTLNF